MVMFHSSLKSEDVKFFYSILYQYEKEGKDNHAGYSYKDVPHEIKDKVDLIHDTDKYKVELKFPESLNTLCFKGKRVSAPLLKHLRNGLAHACIEREGEYYLINSNEEPKCKICGKIKRKDLMNLVNAILSTKEEK